MEVMKKFGIKKKWFNVEKLRCRKKMEVKKSKVKIFLNILKKIEVKVQNYIYACTFTSNKDQADGE